jgi:hypothetical protein
VYTFMGRTRRAPHSRCSSTGSSSSQGPRLD